MKVPKHMPRGRPSSKSDGAAEAFDTIHGFMKRHSLSANAFAIKYKMTPSSVSRAIKSRESATWTPSFSAIYRIALIDAENPSAVDVGRLASYKGPGEAIIRRLLGDIDELVRTLSKAN